MHNNNMERSIMNMLEMSALLFGFFFPFLFWNCSWWCSGTTPGLVYRSYSWFYSVEVNKESCMQNMSSPLDHLSVVQKWGLWTSWPGLLFSRPFTISFLYAFNNVKNPASVIKTTEPRTSWQNWFSSNPI